MRYTPTQYAKALYELVDAEPRKAKDIVHQFAHTLAKQGRISSLQAICNEFEREWYAQKEIVPVTVEVASAGAVSKASLKKIAGKEIEITEKINPALGAGARITIGDTRIDNTLARRIADLKQAVSKL